MLDEHSSRPSPSVHEDKESHEPTRDSEPDEAKNEDGGREPSLSLVEETAAWSFVNDPANPFNWSKVRKWAVVANVSAMMFLNVVATMACTPAVPEIMVYFGSTNASYSTLLVSIWEIGECFGPFLIGPLADYFGRRPVWHTCNILYIACSIACGFSTNIHMLLAFRFLNGFVSAPLTLGPAIASDMFRPEQRGTAIGIANMIPMTGLSLGPIIGGAIIGQGKSWQWIFWVVSIAVGVFELVSFLTLPETHGAIVLRRRLKDSPTQEVPKFSVSILLRAFKIWMFYPIALIMSLYYAILWGFGYLILTTLTEVLNSQYGIAAEDAGVCFLGWGLGYGIGQLVGGTGSDWYVRWRKNVRGSIEPQDRLPPAAVGGLLAIFGLFLYGWTTQDKIYFVAPIIATGIQTFGAAVVSIAAKAFLIDSFPEYAASATGAGSILMSISGGLLPLAGPPLYAKLGLGWGNSVLGFIALAMTPLPFLLVSLERHGILKPPSMDIL